MKAMITNRTDIFELLRVLLQELLTDYIKSEQYTLELLMSEQTNLYKEIEDEGLREIGIYGFHYTNNASKVYSSLGELTYTMIDSCFTLYVDAAALVVLRDNLHYIIVSNKQDLKSVRLIGRFSGVQNGALQGVEIELTELMTETYTEDIKQQVTKVTFVSNINWSVYMKSYPNLKTIGSLMSINLYNQWISSDYVGQLYHCRQIGCKLLFELLGVNAQYSILKLHACIVLLYFGELKIRVLGDTTLNLGHYSYENIVTSYRCLKGVYMQNLALPVTEDEEFIVKNAMKDMELYIRGCCDGA